MSAARKKAAARPTAKSARAASAAPSAEAETKETSPKYTHPAYVYTDLLKRLLLDVEYGDLDLSDEKASQRVLACDGLDFVAGEIVANAVQHSGLTQRDLVEVLHALAYRVILSAESADEEERGKALLVLAVARTVHERPELADALNEFIDLLKDDEGWKDSKLIEVALDVAFAVLSGGDSVLGLARLADQMMREFFRAVRECCGKETTRRTFVQLDVELRLATGDGSPDRQQPGGTKG
jgi:hypothetical protein